MRRTRDDRRRTLPVRLGGALAVPVLALLLTARIGDAGAAGSPGRADGTTSVDSRRTAERTDTITPAMIALGDSIFHGRVAGGLCATCHGNDAKGIQALGPNLVDATWLHGDGEMPFLETIIRTGVMKPKKSGSVMPPFGGASLNAQQLRAVAAYVYSLSHRTAP